MDDRCRELAHRVGRRVVDRDWAGLCELFTPWLRTSAADVEEMVDIQNDGLPAPASFSVDEGICDLAELREPAEYGPPSMQLASEITDANFRGWISIQFQPDPKHEDECNVCFDVWLVVVEHQGAYRVGYFEAAEAS